MGHDEVRHVGVLSGENTSKDRRGVFNLIERFDLLLEG